MRKETVARMSSKSVSRSIRHYYQLDGHKFNRILHIALKDTVICNLKVNLACTIIIRGMSRNSSVNKLIYCLRELWAYDAK